VVGFAYSETTRKFRSLGLFVVLPAKCPIAECGLRRCGYGLPAINGVVFTGYFCAQIPGHKIPMELANVNWMSGLFPPPVWLSKHTRHTHLKRAGFQAESPGPAQDDPPVVLEVVV